ncbi:MAG: hypothetical protein ACTJHT_06745 [Sphingobacterium sp.]
MKGAIIYIRISTDEQAQKGYFQRSQEEKVSIVKTIILRLSRPYLKTILQKNLNDEHGAP